MWSDPFAALLRYLGLKDQPSTYASGEPIDPRVVVEPVDDDAPVSHALQKQLQGRRTLLIVLGMAIGLFVWWIIVLRGGATFGSISLVSLGTVIGVLVALRLFRGPLDEMTETITRPVDVPKRIRVGIPPGETLVWQSRAHPMSQLSWWILLALVQVIAVSIAFGGTPLIALILWAVGVVIVLARMFLWNRTRICVTNQRVFVATGWIKVDYLTMPLDKVTDLKMRFTRPSTLLGHTRFIKRRYATLVFESAGQDQALSKITHVPNGAEVYRLILSLVQPAKS
jgi:PH (Pleckstrin Homology) domain-containing protein